jgi:hypothetical protein
MKVLELPAGTAPGSPEAVAFIEAQISSSTAVDPMEPQPEGTAVPPAPAAVGAYDLIIAGLEMMLDGFKELNSDK